jgi:transposase, IS30 family
MQYKHFSIEEREEIQLGLWRKESVRSIAKRLGRSHTSVAREVLKNMPPTLRRYAPRLANARAFTQRKSRGRTLRLKNARIRAYVVFHLKLRWSPEQIAGRMPHDLGKTLSHEAIYQFIYAQVKNGLTVLGGIDLRSCLRRRRKRRVPHGARRGQRVASPMGVSIDARPKIVTHRTRIGDWEGDTIQSVNNEPGVNTLNERKSGIILITKLKDKTSAATSEAVCTRFSAIPEERRHTLTLDNGSENARWRAIERDTGVKTFFAHPYHSWERGSNENGNGLIRDFFPKKTDFALITDATIATVEYALNTRPRKRLKYRTPLEVWSGALQG